MGSNKYRMAIRLPLKEWSLGSSLLAVMLVFLLPRIACAHGMIGDRIFLSPIIRNDAFRDNAASITTRGSNHEFSLLPELERQLSDKSSLLFTGGWSRINPASPQQTIEGACDLICFRQAAFKSAQHELEVTVSPFLIVPSGDRQDT